MRDKLVMDDSILELIELKYYEGKDSQRSPEHNWEVWFGGHHIGDLHCANGIGGHIGDFTETMLFDHVCHLAKEDLHERLAEEQYQLRSKILDLISFLDVHGDESTEEIYSALDRYVKSSQE